MHRLSSLHHHRCFLVFLASISNPGGFGRVPNVKGTLCTMHGFSQVSPTRAQRLLPEVRRPSGALSAHGQHIPATTQAIKRARVVARHRMDSPISLRTTCSRTRPRIHPRRVRAPGAPSSTQSTASSTDYGRSVRRALFSITTRPNVPSLLVESPSPSSASRFCSQTHRSLWLAQNIAPLQCCFRESQFDIILRSQRARPDGGGLRHTLTPSSCFLNLSSDSEFVGWGYLRVTGHRRSLWRLLADFPVGRKIHAVPQALHHGRARICAPDPWCTVFMHAAVFHVATMVALALVCVHRGRAGNGQLQGNWVVGQAPTSAGVEHKLSNGFCLGRLELPATECAPSYIGRIKPGRFPRVLCNLHLPAIALNTLVLATVPLETVLRSANALNVLAEMAAGRWPRTRHCGGSVRRSPHRYPERVRALHAARAIFRRPVSSLPRPRSHMETRSTTLLSDVRLPLPCD
ncbi:hypothetical protein B0H15DRAFT_1025944 [Mycena belliarum]|uniref:Uncharacterized protein n=1 Tax=Mycena belliarum TaxID=1033014 RepID=A0AAD6TUU9_9AGAR|nr:hypothetical protein B0H15DRAFT_1025944 [Mycena belliae]